MVMVTPADDTTNTPTPTILPRTAMFYINDEYGKLLSMLMPTTMTLLLWVVGCHAVGPTWDLPLARSCRDKTESSLSHRPRSLNQAQGVVTMNYLHQSILM